MIPKRGCLYRDNNSIVARLAIEVGSKYYKLRCDHSADEGDESIETFPVIRIVGEFFHQHFFLVGAFVPLGKEAK